VIFHLQPVLPGDQPTKGDELGTYNHTLQLFFCFTASSEVDSSSVCQANGHACVRATRIRQQTGTKLWARLVHQPCNVYAVVLLVPVLDHLTMNVNLSSGNKFYFELLTSWSRYYYFVALVWLPGLVEAAKLLQRPRLERGFAKYFVGICTASREIVCQWATRLSFNSLAVPTAMELESCRILLNRSFILLWLHLSPS
jgi:hypothetical protein